VTEAFRGRGIARALMAEVFRAMAYEGYGYAVIPWVNATGYYRDAVGAIEIPDSEPGIYVRKIGK
jgi:GNAT superfamily N-acetyltransferase